MIDPEAAAPVRAEMTVRAWFRLVRASFWQNCPGDAADIDAVANFCTNHLGYPIRWWRCGPFACIEDAEDVVARERMLDKLSLDMREALGL